MKRMYGLAVCSVLFLSCAVEEGDGGGGGGGAADNFNPASDCASRNQSRRENAQSCFQAALDGASELVASQSNQVANAFSPAVGLDICEVLRPLFGSNDPTGAAVFAGFMLGASTGVNDIGAGVDQVWDLYHYQMINSVLAGYGLSSFTFGPSAQIFAGLAFNFQQDAGDWYGWFQGGGVTFTVPQVPFLSLGVGLFASAVDANGDGFPEQLPFDGAFPAGTYGVAGIAQISIPLSQWALPGWVNRAAGVTYFRRSWGGFVNPTYYSPHQTLMQTSYNTIRGLVSTVATPIGRTSDSAAGGMGLAFDGSDQSFNAASCWQGDNVCALEFTGDYHFSRGARMSAAMAVLLPGQGSAVWSSMILIPAAYGALRSAGGALGQALEEVCGPSGS